MIVGCVKYTCGHKPVTPVTSLSRLNNYGRGLEVSYNLKNGTDTSKCNCGFVYPIGDSGDDDQDQPSLGKRQGQVLQNMNNTGGCGVSIKDYTRNRKGGTLSDLSYGSKKSGGTISASQYDRVVSEMGNAHDLNNSN